MFKFDREPEGRKDEIHARGPAGIARCPFLSPNVFEEEPPPGTRTGRFTGGSPYYDPIGRFYYGGLKVSF